jgi:hypothetical protein
MAFEDGVFATFIEDAVEDKRKTKAAGYPVFGEPRLFIKIVIPNAIGEKYRPATDADIKRFPVSYEAYQRGSEAPEAGLPVEHWPQVTTAEVKLLKAVNVKTVEQLAELPDSGLHRLGPGGRGLKNRAAKFLATAGDNAALKARIQELERKIEALETPDARVGETAKEQAHKPKKLKVSSA